MSKKSEAIQESIFNAATGKAVISWFEIMAAVNGDGIKIKDWRQVRNVLQQFIDANMMARHEDIRVEQYRIG